MRGKNGGGGGRGDGGFPGEIAMNGLRETVTHAVEGSDVIFVPPLISWLLWM